MTPNSPTCAECWNCEGSCGSLQVTIVTCPVEHLNDYGQCIYDCPEEGHASCCLCMQSAEPCEPCSDRRDRESERAYESFCEAYYGGSQPVTIEEQYQAAAAQKRRLS